MPTGLKGQSRPADVTGGAFRVAKITTNDIEEETLPDFLRIVANS